jgi:hypothetical protein
MGQLNGHRGQTDTLEQMQRRFECDLRYIEASPSSST